MGVLPQQHTLLGLKRTHVSDALGYLVAEPFFESVGTGGDVKIGRLTETQLTLGSVGSPPISIG